MYAKKWARAVASRHGRLRSSIAPGARLCRTPCRGRGAPAGKLRHAKLSACAGSKAAHRAEARRRDGDIAPYRHAARGRAHGEGAREMRAQCHAAHRADGAAARWGHRALPPCRTRGARGEGHGRCARRGGARQAAREVRAARGTRGGDGRARGRRGCAGKASRAGQAGCRILGAVLVLSGLSIEKKSRSVFFGSFAEAIADGGFVQPVFGVST